MLLLVIYLVMLVMVEVGWVLGPPIFPPTIFFGTYVRDGRLCKYWTYSKVTPIVSYWSRDDQFGDCGGSSFYDDGRCGVGPSTKNSGVNG